MTRFREVQMVSRSAVVGFLIHCSSRPNREKVEKDFHLPPFELGFSMVQRQVFKLPLSKHTDRRAATLWSMTNKLLNNRVEINDAKSKAQDDKIPFLLFQVAYGFLDQISHRQQQTTNNTVACRSVQKEIKKPEAIILLFLLLLLPQLTMTTGLSALSHAHHSTDLLQQRLYRAYARKTRKHDE